MKKNRVVFLSLIATMLMGFQNCSKVGVQDLSSTLEKGGQNTAGDETNAGDTETPQDDEAAGTSGLLEGNPGQFLLQLGGVAVALVWPAAVTFVLLKIIDGFVPLRVGRQQEIEGLDISLHGEALQ